MFCIAVAPSGHILKPKKCSMDRCLSDVRVDNRIGFPEQQPRPNKPY